MATAGSVILAVPEYRLDMISRRRGGRFGAQVQVVALALTTNAKLAHFTYTEFSFTTPLEFKHFYPNLWTKDSRHVQKFR